MVVANIRPGKECLKISPNELASTRRTYTVSEVAKILGVSLRTVYYLCESAKYFRFIRMGRRCIRIHKESFDKWLDQE